MNLNNIPKQLVILSAAFIFIQCTEDNLILPVSISQENGMQALSEAPDPTGNTIIIRPSGDIRGEKDLKVIRDAFKKLSQAGGTLQLEAGRFYLKEPIQVTLGDLKSKFPLKFTGSGIQNTVIETVRGFNGMEHKSSVFLFQGGSIVISNSQYRLLNVLLYCLSSALLQISIQNLRQILKLLMLNLLEE